MFGVPLHEHLGGSNPSRKILLLDIARSVEGKLFQVLKVHLRMGRIQGRRGEEMAKFGPFLFFVKIWAEDLVFIVNYN